MWYSFATFSLCAQTIIDGRTAYYDSRTDTYLISVQENYELGALPEGLNVELTHLPIIQLNPPAEGSFATSYRNCTMSISLPTPVSTNIYHAKVKYRGGSTNNSTKHKRNFHIKLIDEEGNKVEKSLLGLRHDDSFLLDAGQNDLGRIRNHVAHEIWRDMDNAPYYAVVEKDAKNYIDCEFAEVFIGEEYFGLYSLTEAIDRKQMQLMKYDTGTNDIHGMLYKTKSFTYTTMYGPFDAPDNNSGTWGGFEMKYPDINDVCPTYWDLLYNALLFVDESSTSRFSRDVGKYFDIPILIDFFVFNTVLAAVDHDGKNIYWAYYDVQQEQPMLTLAIWDYDTMIGQTWDNSEVHTEATKPDHGNFMRFADTQLLERLAADNVEDFVNRAVARYWELRPTVFDADSLIERFSGYFDMLRRSGTLAREEARWSGDTDINGYPLDFADEEEFIAGWLRLRLTYLDGIFTEGAGIKSVSNSWENISDARYNINGQCVDESYKGIVISNGKKVLVR